MPRQVNFTIEINDDGEAIMRLPEGKGQQRDANAVAPLTEQIAKALGTIKERHVGAHHHHHDDHHHDHEHVTTGE